MSLPSRPWSTRPPQNLLTGETYIRCLPYSLCKRIADELDPVGPATNWKNLVLKIPKSPHNPEPKYTIQHIRRFEAVAHRGESPTMAIISSWATTNATVKNLIEILSSLGLHSLVTMVQSRITQPPSYDETLRRDISPILPQQSIPGQSAQYEPIQNRVNSFSPSIPQPLSFHHSFPPVESKHNSISNSNNEASTSHQPMQSKSMQEQPFSRPEYHRQPTEHDSLESVLDTQNENLHQFSTGNVSSFPYSSLKLVTSNFNNSLKLGEGAFGSVFQGKLSRTTQILGKASSEVCKIAIKRLKLDTPEFASAITEQFKKEIHVISELQHENILPLMGYSCDGPELCLIYDYMFNGSLSSRLDLCRKGDAILTVPQRLEIARGSACGISYLHKKELIHRDIKSSNILLDSEMKPRISDFGLIRSTSSDSASRTSTKTSNPIGTLVYMSPEACKGNISFSMDVYSFGVVLLELLTGMAVIDESRDPSHLTMYIEEKEDEVEISTFFDELAGDWGPKVGEDLYGLASKCLVYRRTQRPTMQKVFADLASFCQDQASNH